MAIDFRECLQAIQSSCDGVVFATLMGMDAVPVDQVQAEGGDIDIPSLLVEYATVLKQLEGSAQTFAAGSLQELSITSESLVTIFRPVTPEYFLAVALTPGANVGKGRYLLRINAPKLVDELS